MLAKNIIVFRENGNHYVFGIIHGKSIFLLQYFMKTKDQIVSEQKSQTFAGNE